MSSLLSLLAAQGTVNVLPILGFSVTECRVEVPVLDNPYLHDIDGKKWFVDESFHGRYKWQTPAFQIKGGDNVARTNPFFDL